MKKYAIAFFDYFEGELTLDIVEGTSDLDALKNSGLFKANESDITWEDFTNAKDFEKTWLGDDFCLEIKEV